ncbi:hypothetical protein [uncultured Cellulomonas sp.]|uniref:hypothetical protein n=1 Tax=uncultured Cellulomonas sp. TaxID=189682 RepID=UPI0028E2FE72|nr:hypothetical protein [uncultured Cellulomonas sp.]
MTERGDHGWFDEDWDDEDDDTWEDLPRAVDGAGPDDDLPDPPGAVLRTASDALAVLLDLVGPERAGPPALWFLLLDADDHVLPVVLPVTDVPLRADPDVAQRLLAVLASVLASDAPGGSVVIGLVRAAGGDRGAFEASWVPALRGAGDDLGVPIWAVVAVGERRARVLEW